MLHRVFLLSVGELHGVKGEAISLCSYAFLFCVRLRFEFLGLGYDLGLFSLFVDYFVFCYMVNVRAEVFICRRFHSETHVYLLILFRL